MSKSRKPKKPGRVVKFKKLVRGLKSNLEWWLSSQKDFLYEVIHLRGKKLHLTIWPGRSEEKLGFTEREWLRNVITTQVARFGLIFEEFFARGRGVYCCLRLAPG